jgi:two-component system, LytTR family, response regulator
MQVLVIEDEKLAAERLIAMIKELEPAVQILQWLESVRTAIKWLETHPHPDLIMMDVQLADGLCFEIFEKTAIDVPVIFTTAYNEYAIRAFKVNSIDYLLKPIDKIELKASLQKYQKMNFQAAGSAIQPQLLKQVMDMIKNPYKTRFVVRIAEHIKAIGIEDIVYFYTCEKSSFLRTSSGREFAIDSSLDQLEDELDPKKFFRVSRQFILALPYILDIIAYSGNRLKIKVTGSEQTEILVSREKVTTFKKWLEG